MRTNVKNKYIAPVVKICSYKVSNMPAGVLNSLSFSVDGVNKQLLYDDMVKAHLINMCTKIRTKQILNVNFGLNSKKQAVRLHVPKALQSISDDNLLIASFISKIKDIGQVTTIILTPKSTIFKNGDKDFPCRYVLV